MIAAEPSWQDVLGRRARLRARRLRRRGALLAVVALLLAAGPALGVDGWLRGLLPGEPVPVSKLAAEDLTALFSAGRAVPLPDLSVRLVGRRGGLLFYVIELKGGAYCFAAGIPNQGPVFGSVRCPRRVGAVVDLSLEYGGRISVLAGFAFGDVASVGVAGKRVPVERHLYEATDVPRGAFGPLAAYDKAGRVISRTAARSRCSVRLYLVHGVTAAQVAHTVEAARADPRVAGASFRSKTAALAALEPRFRTTTHSYNPLPDAIEVVPASPAQTGLVAKRLAAEHLPAVVSLRYGCSS